MTAVTESCGVVVQIGGLPIRLRCSDLDFVRQIEERYTGFLGSSNDARFEFEIEAGIVRGAEEACVTLLNLAHEIPVGTAQSNGKAANLNHHAAAFAYRGHTRHLTPRKNTLLQPASRRTYR